MGMPGVDNMTTQSSFGVSRIKQCVESKLKVYVQNLKMCAVFRPRFVRTQRWKVRPLVLSRKQFWVVLSSYSLRSTQVFVFNRSLTLSWRTRRGKCVLSTLLTTTSLTATTRSQRWGGRFTCVVSVTSIFSLVITQGSGKRPLDIVLVTNENIHQFHCSWHLENDPSSHF